jgi:hypothetical protein
MGTKGLRWSEEVKRKISLAAKRRWADPKSAERRKAVGKILGEYGKKHFVGSGNPAWKGGRSLLKDGKSSYVSVWTGNKNRRQEHMLVMEKKLGRKLASHERVHHLNGNSTDNRLENLRLFATQSEHIKEEQKLGRFAKQILFGELAPRLRAELRRIYQDFESVK